MLALKPGKIYQEMIEVPDQEEGGCGGCILWIIGIALVIWLGTKALNVMSEHTFASFVLIVVLIVAYFKFRKR